MFDEYEWYKERCCRSQLYLWEILVPNFLDGKKLDLPFHWAWDKEVKKISGGLTVLKPVKGRWTNDGGNAVHEQMIPVRIACTKQQINEIAKFTLEYYKQDAVMYYKVSNEVNFIRRENI